MVEDEAHDAALVEHTLKQGGFDFSFKRSSGLIPSQAISANSSAFEANKLGVKPVGHTPESIYIEDAANAGLRSSEHPFGFGKIIPKLLGEPVGLSTAGMGTDAPYFLRFNEVNRDEFRKALKRIGATGMHVCPTLVVFKHGAHLREIFANEYPMLEYASPMIKGCPFAWAPVYQGQGRRQNLRFNARQSCGGPIA